MRFIKLLKFDITNGILRNKFFMISTFALSALFMIDNFINMNRIREYNVECSFGDVLTYIYGGMKNYVSSREDRFRFPAIWTTLFITQLFGTLNYPYKDLNSYGKQILIRTNGRMLCWLSKCIWNIIYTLLYHATIWSFCLIYCIAFKYNIDFSINVKLIAYNFEIPQPELVENISKLPLYIFLVPVITSIVLCLIEMTLSLFFKTINSFLIMSCITICSAYLSKSFMIGNYGMIIRCKEILPDGINFDTALPLLCGIMIATFIIGLVKFKRYDIINS